MACSGACGIGAAREAERERARAAAALAYPGLVWSAVPAFAAPVDELELRALADSIDDVVAAWQSLEFHASGAATLRMEAQFGENVAKPTSSCLELVVSPLGRFVTLREVYTERSEGGMRTVARVGVDDHRWASAVKAIQGVLRARSLSLLDMAFLSEPVPEAVAQAYEERFGERLTWWSLLFLPEPPGLVTYRRGPSE